jgi:hypothetical protein
MPSVTDAEAAGGGGYLYTPSTSPLALPGTDFLGGFNV